MRDVADGLQQTSAIKPVDPSQRCKLDSFKGSPRFAPVDHFGFVKTVDRFCKGVVITVTKALSSWRPMLVKDPLRSRYSCSPKRLDGLVM